jgi:hypothetical protein
VTRPAVQSVRKELPKCGERVREYLLSGRGFDLELELAGVLRPPEPAVPVRIRARSTTSSIARRRSVRGFTRQRSSIS